MTTGEQPTREQRRRRTEAAILQAAREAFGEAGFERTTIRAVAAAAGVDPALVMQYFGSKEGLFAAAAQWQPGSDSVLTADAERLPSAALSDMFARFEDADTAESAVALLRSCLTHPVASRVMRDDVMCERRDAVAAALGGEDAELRAAVFGTVMMGLGMGRYLLEHEPLASASQEELRRVVEPLLRALVDPQ